MRLILSGIRKKAFFISLGLTFLTLILFLMRYEKKKSEVKIIPNSVWEIGLQRVSDSWELGVDLNDPHLLKNCPIFKDNYRDTPKLLTSCRPKVFKCFYENRIEKIKYKGKYLTFQVKLLANFLNKRVIRLNIEGDKKLIYLKDFCSMAQLPPGNHLGTSHRKNNYQVWNTSGLIYFIDKYLVRNIDILTWAEKEHSIYQKEAKQSWEIINTGNQKKDILFKPVTKLTPDLMEKFCYSRNSQLVTSDVIDAVTFHHGRNSVNDLQEALPSKSTSPYPFTIRKSDSPQFKAEKGDYNILKDDCRLIFARECWEKFKLEVNDFFPFSLGWSGVSELLGGPIEFVRNIRFPKKNVRLSSYYFPMNSTWHQANRYAYWDGEGKDFKNFSFYGHVPEEAVRELSDISFRCMKVISQ